MSSHSVSTSNSPGDSRRPTAAAPVTFDFWGAVKRHRGLMAFGLLIGIGLAMAYQFLAIPKYRSEMQVMVMQRDSGMLAGQRDGTPDAEGLAVEENVLASHMQLLGSRRIIQDAIDRYDIAELGSIRHEVAEGRDPVLYIQTNLSLSLGGTGAGRAANVVTASLLDPSPQDCATILTAILSSYQDFLSDKFADSSTEAIEIITETRDRLAKQQDDVERRYVEFRRTAPLIWDGDVITNKHKKRVEEIELELASVRERENEVRNRLRLIEQEIAAKGEDKLTDNDRLALLSDAETDRLRLFLQITKGDVSSEEFQAMQPIRTATANTQYQELLSLMLTERTLLSEFGTDHPRVEVVRDKIRVIQDYLNTNRPADAVNQEIKQMKPAEMLEAYINLLKHDRNEYSGRRAELEAEFDVESSKSRDLYAFERQGLALVEEIDQIRRTKESVLARLGDMSLKRQYGGSLPEVIAPPMAQQQPAWPRLPIMLAVGTVLGLFLGTSLAMLAELSDSTFRNPAALQAVVGMPVTAHVPYTVAKRFDKHSSIDRSVFVKHDAASVGTEAIRRIRTSLFFYSRNQNSRVFAITSPTPGDGKSLLSANLCLAIANAGKSVLLIDADMRRPRQHTLLGLATTPGLSDVLLEQAEWPDSIQNVADVAHLSVLTCGEANPNPAEILSRPALQTFLEASREKYDFIIIDTPPILAVSDAGIICEHVDGVILATRVTKNGREAVVSAKRILDELQANVIALVVNSTVRGEKGFGYVDCDKRAFEYGYSSDRTSERYCRVVGAPVPGAALHNGADGANGAAASNGQSSAANGHVLPSGPGKSGGKDPVLRR